MELAERRAFWLRLRDLILGAALTLAAGAVVPACTAGEDSAPTPAPGEADSGEPQPGDEVAASPAFNSEPSEPRSVAGAPDTVKLGFNNSEQVVTVDGGSLLVWVASGDLQLARRDAAGNVLSATTIATGRLTLPAVARDGQTLVVGWVENDNTGSVVKAAVSFDSGGAFEPAATLGAGNGISLTATDGHVAAVWHDGDEGVGAKIMFAKFEGREWSAPSRIDASTGAPVWAAIAARSAGLYVTWRDDRAGPYMIWLRRSEDWGETWLPEQQLTTDISGDPDVCVSNDAVWVAHHGKSEITLLRSTDGGASFGGAQSAGNGWFAHLACGDSAVAIAWEATTGSARAEDKTVGWAVYDATGSRHAGGVIEDGPSAATTALLAGDNRTLEVIWLRVPPESPLEGELRHSFVGVR